MSLVNPTLIIPLVLAAGLLGVCLWATYENLKARPYQRDWSVTWYFGFFFVLILLVCSLVQLNS